MTKKTLQEQIDVINAAGARLADTAPAFYRIGARISGAFASPSQLEYEDLLRSFQMVFGATEDDMRKVTEYLQADRGTSLYQLRILYEVACMRHFDHIDALIQYVRGGGTAEPILQLLRLIPLIDPVPPTRWQRLRRWVRNLLRR